VGPLAIASNGVLAKQTRQMWNSDNCDSAARESVRHGQNLVSEPYAFLSTWPYMNKT